MQLLLGCVLFLFSATSFSQNIAKQKCEEYGRLFEDLNVECGNLDPKSSGGILPNEFPHIVLIGFGNNTEDINYACVGALVSNDYVISTAHCAASFIGPPQWALTATVGPDSGQPIEISEIIVHPDYIQRNHSNDIALLKLKDPITFKKTARPACLPYEPVSFETEPNIQTVGIGIFIESTKYLIKGPLNYMSVEECNQVYVLKNGRFQSLISSESTVCLIDKSGSSADCIGGPVHSLLPGCMSKLVAVNSFGKRCLGPREKSVGSVYTNIHHFLPWIEQTIWSQ